MNQPESSLTFFFCIGVPKSGTTLIARVLDQHPAIACIWESYGFHPRSGSSIFNPVSNSWRTHGFSRAKVEGWAAIWRRQPQLALRRIVRKLTGRSILVTKPFRQTMKAALADFAKRCEAEAVGDKWPWYIEFLEPLVDAFPEAKFIYNVRDPRGLWNSAQQFKGRRRGDEMLQRLLASDVAVSEYQDDRRFLTLRYEDLVWEPEVTARKLYGFLGFDFSPAYLTYEADEDFYRARWSWIPEATEQFNRWHTIKWIEQMNTAQIDRVTVQAKEFIEKYGYDDMW